MNKKRSLNLKYSKNTSVFFTGIATVREVIKAHTHTKKHIPKTSRDDTEIGRGNSYAVLPELKEEVASRTPITIDSFKRALTGRGVSDINFQNKILCMLLQTKLALHFGLANVIINLLTSADNDNPVCIDNKNLELSLEINNNDVALIFKGDFSLAPYDAQSIKVSVSYRVNITPDMVAITDFNITHISDNDKTQDFYTALKDQQQNILYQILTYIKRLLGFNSELRLEESSHDDVAWGSFFCDSI